MNGAPPDTWHPVPVTVLKVHTHLIHLQHKVVLCKVWRVIVHVLNQNLNGLVDLEEFRNQLSLRSDTHHDVRKKNKHKHTSSNWLWASSLTNHVTPRLNAVLTDLEPTLLHWTQTTRAALDRD